MAREERAGPPMSRTRSWARGLYTSVSGNAQAFGFSITVTVTFQVVSSAAGHPSTAQMMAFAAASVAAFSLLNVALAVTLDVDRSESEPTRVVLLATATDFLAVGAGVAAASGLVKLVDGWWAWVTAPFAATLVYVVVQALELVAGRHEDEGTDG